MFDEKMIESNKIRFIELLQSIDREGMDVDKLINKLCNSDFFIAPASTKYHYAFRGGLCAHSLNVYDNLNSLWRMKGCPEVDENSIKIVGLLHDISKMNIYEIYFKNEKVYCADGDKRDENGTFKWVSKSAYKQKDNKFTYGSHEMTSEFIARQFVPLTIDESVAILHHMGGMNWDSAKDDLGAVFGQYSLATLVHLADMLATYIDEG